MAVVPLWRAAGLGGALALALFASGPPARAQSDAPIDMHSGNHPGYGRLVLTFDRRVAVHQARDGAHLVLRFGPSVSISPPARLARNIRAVEGGTGQAEITIAAGAKARVYWLGSRLVVDVFDPTGPLEETHASPPPAPTPAAAPPPAPATPAPPRTAAAALPPAPVPPTQPVSPQSAAPPTERPAAAPVPGAASPTPAQSDLARGGAACCRVLAGEGRPPTTSLTQTGKSWVAGPSPAMTQPNVVAPPATPAPAPNPPSAGPMALSATRPTTPPSAGPALIIPFSATASAAAFRRGDTALVVFDERRPIDLSGVRGDPVFGGATVQLLPGATALRLPLPHGKDLALEKLQDGWRIGVTDPATTAQPLPVRAIDGQLPLPLDAPGDVVAVTDPLTGGVLLVGTQHGMAQAMAALHRTPQFDLLPTWQGVVVAPLADNLVLRATPTGLLLTGGPAGLAMSPYSAALQAEADAVGLTRHFDLRPQLPSVLLQRLRMEVDAAAAPPLGRGRPRLQAAATLTALGWGAEAQAMVQLAASDDPSIATSPDAQGLAAIAALLAHRPAEAGAIDDPRLDGSDEVALWRAVRQAELTPDSPQAAAGFAATAPLIDVYPVALRRRLLPLAVETMIAGGELTPAGRLLSAHLEAPELAMARGMLRQANGDIDGALAAYDALANGPDRRLHAIAAVRAIELRLHAGRISAIQAADALDRLLYAWRGGKREEALRDRIAELRQQTGDWRGALAALHRAEALFPDDAAAIHVRLKDCFAAFLRDTALDRLAPLELAALVEENTDLLPAGAAGEALEERLADRLLALDLPWRAAPVLEKLARAAPTAVGRAGFATRLAALRLRAEDPKGALAALAMADAPDLPPAMAESRALIEAEARARGGDTEGAVAVLARFGSAATDNARAVLLERAKDWPGAEQALGTYVDKTVPPAGALDEALQRSLVRYATAAAQAGDDATLAALRERYTARMPAGPLADMFRLLTAEPVQGVRDLPRAGQENVLAHELPKTLSALTAPSMTP